MNQSGTRVLKMADKRVNPLLSGSIARNLSDKLYERRKLGALEVEQLVKDSAKGGSKGKVTEIITALNTDFIESQSQHARKGGLIAMAAIALGLGSDVSEYIHLLLPPVINCFSDPDHKVRYYALESLFNISKVARGHCLKFFNEIFDSLCKLVADPDKSVKDGAELLDRLMKDIVTEGGHAFDVENFIPLLSDRIHVTSPECRRFLVGWIRILDTVPNFDLVEHLPHFLDGLFRMLSDKSEDIKSSVNGCLGLLLEEIKSAAQAHEQKEKQNVRRGLERDLRPSEEALAKKSQQEWDQINAVTNATSGGDDTNTPTLSPKHERSTIVPEQQQVPQEFPSAGTPTVDPIKKRKQKKFTITSTLTPSAEENPSEEISNKNDGTSPDPNIVAEPTLPSSNTEGADSSITDSTTSTSTSNSNATTTTSANETSLTSPTVGAEIAATTTDPTTTTETTSAETTKTATTTSSTMEDSTKGNQPENSGIQTLNESPTKKKPRTRLPIGAASAGTEITPPKIHYGSIVKILIPHCESPDEFTTNTALSWIHEFINIGKESILPYSAKMLAGILPQISSKSKSTERAARKANTSMQNLIRQTFVPIPVKEFLDVLTTNFQSQFVPTRTYSLGWALILHLKTPGELLQHLDLLFPHLLNMLSDMAEDVVRLDLQALAKFSANEKYFLKLVSSLITLFRENRKLLETRAILIIRQLSVYIQNEKIYRALSELLENEQDTDFASIMIQTLNLILLTSTELLEVRNSLKSLNNKRSQDLFQVLYRSWCHNEAAVVSLCLYSQVYAHASNVVFKFADFEITVNTLMEIDKLVQLLESPIFLHLRLQLLEPEKYPYLFKTLYGLLMLLPQTAAFTTLRNRLTTVTTIGVLHMIPRSSDIPPLPEGIDFTALLEHFVKVRRRHHEHVVEVRLNAEQQASNALFAPREKKRKAPQNQGQVNSPISIGNRTATPKVSSSNFNSNNTGDNSNNTNINNNNNNTATTGVVVGVSTPSNQAATANQNTTSNNTNFVWKPAQNDD